MNHNLVTLPYGDVKNRKVDIAILPWGATEPHNQHLPYLTDCILSTDVACEAAERAEEAGVECIVLPAIPMGAQNPGQHDYAFCIHTRSSTQYAILRDIVDSLRRQGIRKLLIVNGHGGNTFKGIIRDLSFDYPDFVIGQADWFAIVPQKGYFENPDDHAGELETSVMMHYHPEWVDLTMAGEGKSSGFAIAGFNNKTAWTPRVWNRVSADTGVGDPRKATAEKGARYAAAVVERIADLLKEWGKKDLY
jgi:creatinine amidohydrolase